MMHSLLDMMVYFFGDVEDYALSAEAESRRWQRRQILCLRSSVISIALQSLYCVSCCGLASTILFMREER